MSPAVMEGSTRVPAREEIFSRLRQRVASLMGRRFGPDRGEDLAQDLMVVLVRRYAHVEGEEILAKLCSAIMGNLKLEEARRRRSIEQEPEEGWRIPDPRPRAEAELCGRERYERLETAILKLKDRCRKMIRLRLEEKTTAHIAETMDMSVNALGVAEFRCRQGLKQILAGASSGGDG